MKCRHKLSVPNRPAWVMGIYFVERYLGESAS